MTNKILDNMPVGIAQHEMMYDAKGNAVDFKYTYVNDEFCKIVNIKKEDIIGNFGKILFPDSYKTKTKYYEQLFKDKTILEDDSICDLSQSYFNIISYKTGRNTFATVFNDITKLQEANNKLNYIATHHKYSKMLNYEGLKKQIEGVRDVDDAICYVVTIKNANSMYSYYGYEFMEKAYSEMGDIFEKYSKRGHLAAHSPYNQMILILLNPTEAELKDVIKHAFYNH